MLSPKAHQPFIASQVKELEDTKLYKQREWYLAFDSSHFHVYVVVVVVIDDEPPRRHRLAIRIDWNDESTLTFKRLTPSDEKRESRVLIGVADFCKRTVELGLVDYMESYKLFRFNCRTVSFLVLYTSGFDADHIYEQYARNNVLCGLVEGECMKLESLRQYLRWQQEKQLKAIARDNADGVCRLF